MKLFIYLDTDIVSSIIAQAEKGYITQQTIENGNETTHTNDKKASISAEASGKGGFLKFLQAEFKGSASGELRSENVDHSSTKELKEKILHDAAFDVAFDYINPIAVDSEINRTGDEGTYIEISRTFEYVDFDYMERLFQKDGIIDYVKKSEAEKIEEQYDSQLGAECNREQLRKAQNKAKSGLRKIIDANNKQYDDAALMVRVLRSLIPYSRILISRDGYLIPLDDTFFRVNPSCMGFKYGGRMTCVGMVTNIIGEGQNHADSNNVFATLQYTANEALRAILPSPESILCVVHPIAVYYGE